MKIGALLAKLAAKAGINTADPKYADLLASTIEVPDEESNKMLSSLFGFEDAKNNYELKTAFYATALDAVDRNLVNIAGELGLNDEQKAKFLGEKDTFKKLTMLPKLADEAYTKKYEATGKKKDELNDENINLKKQNEEIRKANEKALQERDSAHNNEITNLMVRQILSGKKTIYDNGPVSAKVAALDAIIKESLTAAGAQLVRSGDSIALKQAKDNTLDWTNPTGEKLSFEQYADSIFAANKLLAVNDAGSGTPPNNGGGNSNGNGTGNNGAPVINGGSKFNSGTFDSKLQDKIAEQKRILKVS